MNESRDTSVIRHIWRYCNEGQQAKQLFGNDRTTFLNNAVYRNAVSMPIQQIGELAKHLTDDFVETHNTIPWKAIKGMRTWFAYQYMNMDADVIWKVMNEDITVLKSFCDECLLDQNSLRE